jgi:Bacterial Ig-like domain (group 3)
VNITKSLALVASTALAAGALVASTTASAQAANLGAFYLAPNTGTTSSTLTAVTQAGTKCPAGTTGYDILMTGAGVANDLLQGNTSPGLAEDSDSVNLSVGQTFRAFFEREAITTPNGVYNLTMECVGPDFFSVTDTFTQSVTFTSTGGAQNATFTSAAMPGLTTTTNLTGPATATFGSPVTFNVAVEPDATNGQVQFKDGGTNLGAPVTVSGSGLASITVSSLSGGAHTITAEYLGGSGFNASTSNSHAINITAMATSLVLAGPAAATQQYDAAAFTATVTPNVAGTVRFFEGSTTLANNVPVNGSGVATFSTTALSPTTHTIGAEFTPANPANAQPSTATPVTHTVNPPAGVVRTATQTLTVNIDAGDLLISVDGDGQVDLGTAVVDPSGELLTASGAIDPIVITDTRAGDPGWEVSGIVTDFSNGIDGINGFNLGWTPVTPGVADLSPNQFADFIIGSAVTAANEQTVSSTPANPDHGLEASRVFGTAPDDSGNGTAHLNAGLQLNIPTDVSPGDYTALLTFTVIG